MINLQEIELYKVGDQLMGTCPHCMAPEPSLTVNRDNGTLKGLCIACGYEAAEAVKKAVQAITRATTLNEVIVEADAFRGLDLPEKKKIISPWLAEQTITLIAGWRGVGKTWLALGLCDAITRRQNFGPWNTNTKSSAPCLYIDGEMVPQDLRERLMSITGKSPRVAPLYIYNDCHASFLGLPRANLINRRWRDVVKGFATGNGVKLIVLDNLSSLAAGVDENAKRDWDPVNLWLLDLRFAGIATIMLHHTNKGGGQRGTSAREDNIDSSIVLAHPYDYTAEEGARFTMKFKKARVRNQDLPKIADTEFRLQDVEGHLEWTWAATKRKTQLEVLTMIDEGVKQQDIAEALHIDKGYVSRIKSQALKDGHLTDKGKLTQTGFEMVNDLVTDDV